MKRQCVVFVTHVWRPEIARHYARLKRQAGTVLDVFLVYQRGADEAQLPKGLEPDLVISMADTARHFPLRHQEYSQRPLPWGYVDLVWVSAFLDPLLAGYEQFWLVEYDVDFSGDWATFFSAAAQYEGDLLASRLRPVSAEPDFFHLPGYRQPETAPPDPLIAFMPISRLSRRLLDHYRETLLQPGWHGHFEMLLPSIARAGGFSVAELGGEDALVPPERRGLHYDGTFADLYSATTSHGFRPPKSYQYYDSRPHRFARQDRIYHPIKVGLPLRARLHIRFLPQLQQLRRLSRWLRGKS